MHYIYIDKSLKMMFAFFWLLLSSPGFICSFRQKKKISIISIIIILFKHNDIIYGLGLKLA